MDQDELRTHIAAVTDDASTAVLGDWLQQQQEPWGELIALQSNPATAPQAAELLAKIQLDLCPPLSTYGTTAEWSHGFISRAQISSGESWDELLANVTTFLALPVAARVKTVVFAPITRSFAPWRDWQASLDRLIDPWRDLAELARLVPHVTRVGFGPWPAIAAAGYTRMPRFAKISAAFPHATTLELAGYAPEQIEPLALPALKSLAIRFARATDSELQAIASGSYPELERLEIGAGGHMNVTVDEVYNPRDFTDEETENEDDYPDALSRYPETFSAEDLENMRGYDGATADFTRAGLTALLDGRYPKLVHLGLASSKVESATLEPIFECPLLGQLKTLDLSSTWLGTRHVGLLIAAKPRFAHLDAIDLRHNAFTPGDCKTLAKALPNAIVDDQKSVPELFFRYVATVE